MRNCINTLEKIAQSWWSCWEHLITLFEHPPGIRKVIYTTNSIESLNSVICKATKRRKLFSNDVSDMKLVYLAVQDPAKKWTMPIRNWKVVMNRFMIEFGDRISGHP